MNEDGAVFGDEKIRLSVNISHQPVPSSAVKEKTLGLVPNVSTAVGRASTLSFKPRAVARKK